MTKENCILQQGEEAKFLISIDCDGFDTETDDFLVTLSWGFDNQSMTITKSQMSPGNYGAYVFTFDTTGMVGKVTAECTYYVPDSNYPDNLRTEVNRQFICVVATSANPKYLCCPIVDGESDVTYARVTESGIETAYSLLLTSDDDAVTTSDGSEVYVLGNRTTYSLTQTGPELQALLNAIESDYYSS